MPGEIVEVSLILAPVKKQSLIKEWFNQLGAGNRFRCFFQEASPNWQIPVLGFREKSVADAIRLTPALSVTLRQII
jgi:hypothetical protein